MMILGLLYYRRIYSIRLANEIVKIDKEKYDTAWSAYAIDPKNAEAIVTCEASLREGLTEPAHEPIARRYTAEVNFIVRNDSCAQSTTLVVGSCSHTIH